MARYIDVDNDALLIACSFIEYERQQYNGGRKDADRRLQNVRHSVYEPPADSQDGLVEETKGAPEKSICLPDGEVAESRQARPVKVSTQLRVSQSESIDLLGCWTRRDLLIRVQ